MLNGGIEIVLSAFTTVHVFHCGFTRMGERGRARRGGSAETTSAPGRD